jgi:hypothetical protein
LIEIRLFGDLRHYAGDAVPSGEPLHVPAGEGETVGRVLAGMGIDPAEIGNLFLNGRLVPRSVYPITLGYQLAADGPLTAEEWLTIPVQAGDRLGVFPRKMSSVVV